mmetsp:Transcript_31575/g.100679  ORF Transcript_31575/g.100679 Transcript_31575/m.100679 type:complete len:365 (+) Transcript_31575:157-1251(+)
MPDDDVTEKIAGMSVAPVDFDQAFPAMARHMARCKGELFVFSRGSDGGAFVRFDSCGTSPFEPAPVKITVLYEEVDGPPSLMEALCDVEACLIWMQEAQGPCELTLCNPGGEYWEEAGPEELSAEQAPRLRGGESRNVALIQREFWEVHDEPELATVGCSGSYSGYRFAASFPRLDALVRHGCVPPPPGTPPAGNTISADGFVAGTSGVSEACAALMHSGHPSWEVPDRERMHTANGALSFLEAKLPPVEGEPAGHASQCATAAAAEAAKPPPYPPSLRRSDVFPLDRFPIKEDPRVVQRREDPAGAEAEARKMRARLFSSPHFRGGGLFQMCLMEAQHKQANGMELDELDRTVLGPPTQGEDD